MEIVSPPPHAIQTWTELTVGLTGGGERDFVLKAEHGDVLINTPDRLDVTQAGVAPLSTVFNRAHVQWVTLRVRRVTVDVKTGIEVRLPKGVAPHVEAAPE